MKPSFRFISQGVANVHAAALILGAAGFLSRLLGVLRDRLLALTFGAGRELDIYYAAFQIPDFISVIFLLGAASAAILPIFQEYLVEDRHKAEKLISQLATLFLGSALILEAVIFFLVPVLMRIVVPGFSEEERALTVLLTRIILISPVLLGLSSIFSVVTQSFQRLWAYALAPLLYNVGIIVGIIGLVPIWGISGLAGGVVGGALLHFLIQWAAARNLGFAPQLFELSGVRLVVSEGIKRVLRLAFPRVLSLSFTNLTILALTAIGSTLASGSIAVFQLAYNLYFVPIGIFGVSYSVVLFPKISRAYILRDEREFFRELYLGIRTILFWIIPLAVLTVVLRAHLVRVALGAGAFSWEDTRLTAVVLGVMAFSMFAGALSSFIIKVFYALENTWRPFFVNIAASSITVLSAWGLAKFFSEQSELVKIIASFMRIADLPHKEVVGLAIGFSLGLILNILALLIVLSYLTKGIFREIYPFRWEAVGKIIFAALIGGAAAYGLRVNFSETLPLITFWQVLWQGAVSGLMGFTVYLMALYLLGSEEVTNFVTAFRRRFFKVSALPPSWDEEIDLPQHRV